MQRTSALILLMAGSAFASGQYLGKGPHLSYAPTELAPAFAASAPVAGSPSNYSWEQKFEGANWVIMDLSLGGPSFTGRIFQAQVALLPAVPR